MIEFKIAPANAGKRGAAGGGKSILVCSASGCAGLPGVTDLSLWLGALGVLLLLPGLGIKIKKKNKMLCLGLRRVALLL